MQHSNLWQGPTNCLLQFLIIQHVRKFRVRAQAHIYPKFNLSNCVLLLQDVSAGQSVEYSNQS